MIDARVDARRFENTTLIRHGAFLLAVGIAYLLRDRLQAGNEILWVVGVAALLNLQPLFFAGSKWSGISRRLSPIIGVCGWGALAYQTGGIQSPFIAGFGFEIVLSAVSRAVSATIVTTTLALAVLWVQQLLLGASGVWVSLLLESGFLLGMGTITLLVTLIRTSTERDMTERHSELVERLRVLESRLDDARSVERVGENAARLAHGLKNTVHALRGFAGLIARGKPERHESLQALHGLTGCIDQLEELARMTLDPGTRAREAPCDTDEAHRAIEDATTEVSASYPGIRWVKSFDGSPRMLPAPTGVLREVLLVLLRNAAEAMDGRGPVDLSTDSTDRCFRIRVWDHGPALEPADLDHIFKPGYTTKKSGNGFGLYLARRLLESYGGDLIASPAPRGGAVLAITLPVHGSPS